MEPVRNSSLLWSVIPILATLPGLTNNHKTCREAFQRKFVFTCTCHLCSMQSDLSLESDGQVGLDLSWSRSRIAPTNTNANINTNSKCSCSNQVLIYSHTG